MRWAAVSPGCLPDGYRTEVDAARATFESFVRRWQQCDGVSVVKRP